MTLIGLNGQLGSGKDTVYERAKEIGLRPVERLAFADKLKQAAAAALGVHRDVLELYKRDTSAKVVLRVPIQHPDPAIPWLTINEIAYAEKKLTVREYLQRFGTEVGRDVFGDTFWVDQCVPVDLDHEGKVVFVTDVRFPNEAQRIRDAGGVVVRVLNGPLNTEGHASEQILDPSLIDYEIDNSIRDDNHMSLDDQVVLLLNGALPSYA